MRITVKVGVICALIWIAIKYILFALDIFPGKMATSMYWPLSGLFSSLGLLTAISIGLYIQKRRDTMETNALYDIKNAMSAGLPYVVIVSSFLHLFYTQINPEFIKHRIAEGEVSIEKMIKDPEKMDSIRKEYPDAEVMTDAQIEKRAKASNIDNASPGRLTTLATSAMLLLAAFYSLLVTMIFRKVVFR
jgi:hypothetical protein